MKNILLLLLITTINGYTQDLILLNKGDTIKCTIKKIDNKKEEIWFYPLKSNVSDYYSLYKIKYYKKGDTVFVNKAYNPFPQKENGIVSYNKVVEVTGKTKDELFTGANEWFVNTFKSAKDVIQLSDKEAGTLMGKGFSRIDFVNKKFVGYYDLYYTITINFKDGKFKYEITDLIVKSPATTVGTIHTPATEFAFEKTPMSDALFFKDDNPPKVNVEIRSSIMTALEDLQNSLIFHLNKKKSSSDW